MQQKERKILILNKEAPKLTSNLNMLIWKAQEKELCKTSSIIKSRRCTTWVPCLELEGVFPVC